MYNDKKERICGNAPVVPRINIPTNKFTLLFHSSPFSLDKKGFVMTYVTKAYAKEYALSNKTGTDVAYLEHGVFVVDNGLTNAKLSIFVVLNSIIGPIEVFYFACVHTLQ